MASDPQLQHQQPVAAMGAILGGRERQEDFAEIVPLAPADGMGGELLILADGMGGHAGGQVASQVAVAAFRREFVNRQLPLTERLRAALTAANDAVNAAVHANPELKGMGCTLIGAVVADGAITWVSVGDSLLLECSKDKARVINSLHSIGAEIDRDVERGLRSAESAADDPQRHVLLSAVTGGVIAKIDEGTVRLAPGALVLIASDGIETLTRDRIAQIVVQAGNPAAAVETVLAAVSGVMKPDQDNTTVIATRAQAGEALASGSSQRAWLQPRLRRQLGAALAVVLLVGATATLTSIILLSIERPNDTGGQGAKTDHASAGAPASDQAKPVPVGSPQPTDTGLVGSWFWKGAKHKPAYPFPSQPVSPPAAPARKDDPDAQKRPDDAPKKAVTVPAVGPVTGKTAPAKPSVIKPTDGENKIIPPHAATGAPPMGYEHVDEN